MIWPWKLGGRFFETGLECNEPQSARISENPAEIYCVSKPKNWGKAKTNKKELEEEEITNPVEVMDIWKRQRI